MSDTHQFEAFMQAYQNMVFTTAMRLLGNTADAQDIAQEVFLKAYDRFAELSQSRSAGGWLKTVASNLCLNHLTRYRRRWRFFSEFTSDSESEENWAENLAIETASNPSEELEDRHYHLEQALQRLPANQRVALVLYHFNELSYEEIAERLRVSLSKVKTDIHRGRLALARKLGSPQGGQTPPLTNKQT
jgi:RNA polymerase sigma-70 factor (ECF subfamily)